MIEVAESGRHTTVICCRSSYILIVRFALISDVSGGNRRAGRGIGFVREQARQARPGERLPGSTEVLESCFGRFKTLEKDQAKGGFTSLLLGFGSLFSEATIENILAALRAVPTHKVAVWCATHLGQTLFSQRIEAFARARMAQQKLAEATT